MESSVHIFEEHDYSRPRMRRSRAKPRLNVNLTSLIDVTFLLLIYFMVATSMSMGEEAYRMDLPDRSAAGAQGDPFSLDQEPLRIVVSSSGREFVDYHLQLDGPYPQPATFDDLFAFLRKSQINDTNAGSVMLFAPDHPIVIQPQRSTRWEHAIEAFNAAARARYNNITFGKAN